MRKPVVFLLAAGIVGGLGAAGVYASQNLDMTGSDGFSFGFYEPVESSDVRYDVDTTDKDRLFKKAPGTGKASAW